MRKCRKLFEDLNQIRSAKLSRSTAAFDHLCEPEFFCHRLCILVLLYAYIGYLSCLYHDEHREPHLCGVMDEVVS
jgi:hypothetical protein